MPVSGWGPWSGGHVAPDGSNIHPYKVEASRDETADEYLPEGEPV